MLVNVCQQKNRFSKHRQNRVLNMKRLARADNAIRWGRITLLSAAIQFLSLMKHPLSWPYYFRPFLVRKKVGKRMRQTVEPLILQDFPICLYYTIRAHLREYYDCPWRLDEAGAGVVRAQ